MLDLPLETIHSSAFGAAQATHCARDQGKFWEMHDLLFENVRNLEPFSRHAEALGLDVAKFDDCMSSEKHATAVRSDIAMAHSLGATGTPSFVLARTDPDDPGKVVGITYLKGAHPFSSFRVQIDKALRQAE